MNELRRNLTQYLCLGTVLLFSVALNGCSSAASDASKNTAPVVQQVAIITAESFTYVGAVLHGSYLYADSDGDSESGTVKIWLRDGKPILGAQQDNYTVTILDSGQTLQFRVTPVAATGKSPGDAVVSSGIKIENSVPSISDLVIGGSVNGQTYTDLKLTARYSFQDPDGDGEGASTYRWLRNGVTIGGATAQTYIVTRDDIGVPLTVSVTPRDNSVSAKVGIPATSVVITPVNLAPVANNVRIIETASSTPAKRVYAALYDYADHEGDPTGTPLYAWKRNGVTVATTDSFTLTLADVGRVVNVEITPVAQKGSLQGVATAATAFDVPPANIALTVRAGLKQLHFSWAAVTYAAYYRVRYSPDGVSPFVPLSVTSNNLSMTNYDWDISVHRINWPKAQFQLEACDAGSCLPSANISVLAEMINTIGYVKASNTEQNDYFGVSIALSADGNTLAVGASNENSAATGIDGNSLDDCITASPVNCARYSGAVYVYIRSNSTWIQQAYVKASDTVADNRFGRSVALSADGNTLAIGAAAVYVFTRNATTWAQQAYVKSTNTGFADGFGRVAALSSDGNTLAVGAYQDDSAATGVDGNQINGCNVTPVTNCSKDSGAVYVYARRNGIWSQRAYLKASNTEANDNFGSSVALSGDGNTLAISAQGEDSAATGVNNIVPGQTDNSAIVAGAVYVFTLSYFGSWTQQAYVKASNTETYDFFGMSISLSSDGNTLAVGADGEDSAITGIMVDAPNEVATGNGAVSSGAAYVFTRSGTTWSQQAFLKASNARGDDDFGWSLALSADGNALAVGARLEASANTGVTPGTPDKATTLNGNHGNTASGAVYVFTRSAAIWAQQAHVKASNTGINDEFSWSVALSADGSTLAVGANGEYSAATGVNNTVPGQGDNSAPSAGAVYLY